MLPDSHRVEPMFRRYLAEVEKRIIDDESVVRAFEAFPAAGNLLLACDFTEIHSYCHPLEAEDDSNASDGSRGRQVALNQALLEELFFSGRPVVILPSYRIEMDNLRRNIRSDGLSDLASLLEMFHSEEKIAEANAFVERFSKTAPNSSHQQQLTSLSEIYEHAPVLKALFVGPLQPWERLEYLRTHADFRSLPVDANRTWPPSDDTVDWWSARLAEARPDTPRSANVIDALALARLQALNLRHAFRNPIVLVTRSTTMRDLLAEHSANEACQGVYLIHPRFLGLYSRVERSRKTLREEVTDRYWLTNETLTRFATVESDVDYALLPDLKRLVERVRDLWEETDDLTIAKSAFTRVGSQKAARSAEEETIEKIRRFVASQSSVFDLLLNRASKIALEFERSNAGIAAIGVLEESDRNYVLSVEERTQRRRDRFDPVYTAKLPSSEISYSLQLYGDQALQMDSLDAKAILISFMSAKSADPDYERQLAAGYLLASFSAWEIAMAFFNTAIASDSANIPKHEAFYFRALARRHSTKRIKAETVQKALRDVAKANVLKQRTRGEGYWDPRYLNEVGVLIAIAGQNGLTLAPEDLPQNVEADPTAIWKKTLDLIKDDGELALMVLNNLVYLFTHRDSAEELTASLAALRAKSAKLPDTHLPPSTLHTIVMAELTLAKPIGSDVLVFAERLQTILSNSDRISVNDRAVITRDLATLRQRAEGPNSGASNAAPA
jgi:hypothetical protein